MTSIEWLKHYENKIRESHQTFRPNGFEIIEKELKALEIIKKIVKIVDYSDHTIVDGNLVILQGGEIKSKEEYDLLKEVLK